MRLADLLWTMLAVAFLVGYFLVLFGLVLDVFRRDDLGGWARAAWFAALLVVPLVPMVAYALDRRRGGDDTAPDGGAVR